MTCISVKVKVLLCLALVLGVPLVIQAFWAVAPIHPNDIKSALPFVWVVSSEPFGGTNSWRVFFKVFVSPKEKQDEKSFWGVFWVKDEMGRFVANSMIPPRKNSEGVPEGVPKSWAGKCFMFEFTVATNDLSKSEFDMNETIDPKFGTAGTVYQFNLKEFAGSSK